MLYYYIMLGIVYIIAENAISVYQIVIPENYSLASIYLYFMYSVHIL